VSISLLLPSRKRPDIFARMVRSVRQTATKHVEIVARFDEDDQASAQAARGFADIILIGPRIREITALWNECFDACHGDIVCQANDDIVFTTHGWDRLVEAAFAEVPDKIMLVHGNDVFGHGPRFGPHPFVHRRWVETLGYFIPPYFCSDFGDAWPNELANLLGRRRYVPFNIEHMHYSYEMCQADETTLERLARHAEDNPDAIYYSQEKSKQRRDDAKKLADLMLPGVDTTDWVPAGSSPTGMGKCPRCASLATVMLAYRQMMCNACGLEYEQMRR
jgi:hypothetical protein